MKIRNIGKNAFIVDRVKQGTSFVHQVIKPGQSGDVDSKKADKLLAKYPDRFVKDGMIVQAPSEFEIAKKAADEKAAEDAKQKAKDDAVAAAKAKADEAAAAKAAKVKAADSAPEQKAAADA
jgi:hypothetical protein